MLLKKKSVWIVLQYRIIITKYQNIAINSFSIKHEHAHKVVVKNGGCITSHNKRGEQAFLHSLNIDLFRMLNIFYRNVHPLLVVYFYCFI
jgi:hypothetical protein